MVEQLTIDWGEAHKALRDRKQWMGSWVVARDGEEGEYFYEGPGGQVTTHPVPPEAIGLCLRWWPSENEGIGQTQVGAMANLVETYFFPEGTQGTLTIAALSLVR
ncbi:MAG: hypothetical protein HYZ50_07935 [Deltaproteobacteria bacterium]|nr:hypothetical protein [Deltaproteobacteria bacterium]